MVIAEHRVIGVAALAVIGPGDKATLLIRRLEVVAEIVMLPGRTHEQRSQQKILVNDVLRREGPSVRPPGLAEADRGEQQAAFVQRVVPVTIVEEAAARRPNVASGSPDPTWGIRDPVAGPPEEASLLMDPASRDIGAALVWGRRRWAVIEGRPRRGERLECA